MASSLFFIFIFGCRLAKGENEKVGLILLFLVDLVAELRKIVLEI